MNKEEANKLKELIKQAFVGDKQQFCPNSPLFNAIQAMNEQKLVHVFKKIDELTRGD